MALVSEPRIGQGNIVIPEPAVRLRSSAHSEIDRAVAAVRARCAAWAGVTVAERTRLLDRMIADTESVARQWVQAECERKRIRFGTPVAGEEWFLGPSITLRGMRLLRSTLDDIERHGRPRLPGTVCAGRSGQVQARIFPAGVYDRLFFMGVIGDVWMPPGVTTDEVEATIGGVYRTGEHRGRVCAILGAGNVSSIPPNDVLFKVFAEDQVVVLKLNPITEQLGEIYGAAMRALIDGGYLRVVYGGTEEASYLIHHAGVDTVHMTGSDKTHDAIVFGTGSDGERRKADNLSLLDKPVTSELGNVTPQIVVPGPWSHGDIARQAQLQATMFAHGAGYECINTRVIVTDRGWGQRGEMLDAARSTLRQLPHRACFYPGAEQRFDTFLDAHPDAERLGLGGSGTLPWTLIPNVDPGNDDIVFTTDPFTCILAETGLEATSAADFVDRAVAFCNDRIWGTLGVSLIVHPDSMRDPATAAAVERALADLRYGTVAVNTGPALGFALVSPPWGASPGNPANDIGSGQGFVHNTYLFAQPEKTVVRAPFHGFPPRPPYLVTHRREDAALSRVAYFEAGPHPSKLPGIFWHTLRG